MKNLILVLVFFTSISLFAQNFNNETSGFDLTLGKVATGVVENVVDTMFMEHCIIEMIDASQIEKVIFTLRDELQETDLFGAQINMDGSTTLPSGMTFQVDSNEISIITGPYSPRRVLKYTVQLQDVNGNLSEPVILQ